MRARLTGTIATRNTTNTVLSRLCGTGWYAVGGSTICSVGVGFGGGVGLGVGVGVGFGGVVAGRGLGAVRTGGGEAGVVRTGGGGLDRVAEGVGLELGSGNWRGGPEDGFGKRIPPPDA
jgi:hypothetical protein